MKFIWTFIVIFLVFGLIGASVEAGDASPLIAVLLCWLCYKFVFAGLTMQDKEYDPVDFAADDFTD